MDSGSHGVGGDVRKWAWRVYVVCERVRGWLEWLERGGLGTYLDLGGRSGQGCGDVAH